MKPLVVGGIVAILGAGVVDAQPASRFYVGATATAQQVSADDVDSGSFMALGGVVGVRLTRAFSLEFETTRGFGEISRSDTGSFLSFAGPGATREEIQRLAPAMRHDTTWKPGLGWSALSMWRTTEPRRVGFAAFGGVTATHYEERSVMTVLAIPAGVDKTEAELHRMLPDGQVSRWRGGLTGGVLVPIRMTRQLSVAPEVRFTYGSFGDEKYTSLRGGARLLWGF